MLVQNEWDTIAKSFDETRGHPWKECLDFIEGKEGIAVDIACGNGRHLIPLACVVDHAIGIDASPEMIKIAMKNAKNAGIQNVSYVIGNAVSLPFKSNTLDSAIFIAGLHNIKGKEKRRQALKETLRIVKKEGEALISVWARWQDRWRMHFVKEFFRRGRNFGDIYIPWKKDDIDVMRFYHLYGMHELKKDAKKAGFKIMKAWSVKKVSKHYPDNHFLVVKK